MKKSENTTARPVRKTAEITIIGCLKGKKVKQIKANNIAEMWRKIQEVWAISRECTVTVKKDGNDFMKLWSEKKANGSWWQRNKIVETRRSKGGKKYQAAKAAEAETAQETVIPKITEELTPVIETAEA